MSAIKLVSGETVKDIRFSVFASEQGYPEDKVFDDKENSADFLACIDAGRTVGCGRFYKENESDYHIDNIAFGKEMRGKGLGRKLMVEALARIREHFGCEKIILHSQKHAEGFYEKFGFVTVSDEYLEEGVPHVTMKLGVRS